MNFKKIRFSKTGYGKMSKYTFPDKPIIPKSLTFMFEGEEIARYDLKDKKLSRADINFLVKISTQRKFVSAEDFMNTMREAVEDRKRVKEFFEEFSTETGANE